MRLAIWWTGWVAIAATARGVCRLTWQWNIWLRSHITIYYGARKTVVQGSPPRNCLLVSCRRWPVNWASQATTFGEIKRRSACDSPIPVPSARRSGEHHVAVPAGTAAKAALALALRESGLSRVGLAKRLGVDEKAVRRMLDPRHGTAVGRIETALRVLGQELVIETRAA